MISNSTYKVKTFKFLICNHATESYDEKTVTTEEIDDTINNYLIDKHLVDIKVNTVDVRKGHENKNTVYLHYTIICEH